MITIITLSYIIIKIAVMIMVPIISYDRFRKKTRITNRII